MPPKSKKKDKAPKQTKAQENAGKSCKQKKAENQAKRAAEREKRSGVCAIATTLPE